MPWKLVELMQASIQNEVGIHVNVFLSLSLTTRFSYSFSRDKLSCIILHDKDTLLYNFYFTYIKCLCLIVVLSSGS